MNVPPTLWLLWKLSWTKGSHTYTCIAYMYVYVYIYTYYVCIVDFQPGNPHCVSHLLPPPLKKPQTLLSSWLIVPYDLAPRYCVFTYQRARWNIDSTKIAQTALPEATFNILLGKVILSSCQKLFAKKNNVTRYQALQKCENYICTVTFITSIIFWYFCKKCLLNRL